MKKRKKIEESIGSLWGPKGAAQGSQVQGTPARRTGNRGSAVGYPGTDTHQRGPFFRAPGPFFIYRKIICFI